MNKPELARKLVARIAENVKCEVFCFYQGAAVFCDLGRNGNQISPQGVELGYIALQSLQLKIAIGSPAAAIKGEDHEPLRQDIF